MEMLKTIEVSELGEKITGKQNKIFKQIFTLSINAAGETFKGSFEIDKNVKEIIGIQISSDREDILYYRGTQTIKINDEAFLHENSESKLLMCGINLAPNQRYCRLGKINPRNRKVDLIYTDSGSDLIVDFETYKVYLYVYSSLLHHPKFH
ncbi:MAG TPA: hypothetical protein VFJ43_07060 [Bacteroidia bacterium]|nr:hypothetical protein [Bacteroidia bacterium]